VENQDVELLNFLAGELDVISVRGKDYAYLAQFCKKKGFSLYECGPAFGSNFLAFNQNPNRSSKKLRWFRDINFRRAVAYLLDKESMVKNALGGWGYKQWGPMHPQTPFFHPKLKKYDYKPEIARKILQKTGYKDRDGDGWLEDEKGEKLSFTLITNSENTVRRDIGAIICQDLRSVGMDVKFLPMDFNSLVVKLTSTHDWDAVLIGLTGGVEPHFGKNVWESTGHLHFWNPCPSKKQKDYKKKFDVWRKNLAPWEREVDTLFNEGATTLKMEERVRIYRRWQELVAENLPLLYTVRPATIYAIRDRVKNAKPTAFGGALHNMEKLYVID
jgi:peptide/nickel transport system substrate-binding protein